MDTTNRTAWTLAEGMVLVLALLAALTWLGQAWASDPDSTDRLRYMDRAVIEGFRGGSVEGFGKAHVLSVTTTAGTQATTDVSNEGVYVIHFANTGSDAVYVTLDGSTPSASNANLVVPPNMTFTSKTKVPAESIKYVTASGTATLYVCY